MVRRFTPFDDTPARDAAWVRLVTGFRKLDMRDLGAMIAHGEPLPHPEATAIEKTAEAYASGIIKVLYRAFTRS